MRWTVNRIGEPVPERRRMSEFYENPDATKYVRGDRLYAVKAPGSPARRAFKARRLAARAAARSAS